MRKNVTYLQARLLLLLLGAALGVGQTLIAWDRGAQPTEVLAPALVVPIFAAALFLGVPGGLVAAAAASVIYGVLLAEDVESVGIAAFVGLLVTRVSTYVFYALVVAIGTRYVESKLRKLELYDQIDDLTGLYNSAFFLEDSDLEISRSRRYRTLFSVVELDVDRSAFAGLTKRRYKRVIRELGDRVRDAVRKVDRPARVDDGARDRFFVILPETANEGASILTGRMEAATREFLGSRGVSVDGHVRSRALTFPDDEEPLSALREEVRAVEAERRAIADEPAR